MLAKLLLARLLPSFPQIAVFCDCCTVMQCAGYMSAEAWFCAEMIGLSLTYALPIASILNSLLTSSAETEQELVAVERTLRYTEHVPAEVRPGHLWQRSLHLVVVYPKGSCHCCLV